jgi:hypothetical protein
MSILDTIRNQPKGRLAAIGGGVAVVVLVGVALLVFGGDDEEAAPTTTTTTTSTTLAPEIGPIAPLTGLEVDDAELLARPALVVKIDNVPAARPPIGLNQADIVFEERVEGNVTRLAAIFHSRDAEVVGPVRSTRTTDLEIVSLFPRPIFASSGGNNDVMRQVRSADLADVGHNVSGQAFERDRGRPAPHNLFTSTQGLYEKGAEGGPYEAPNPLFTYLEDGDELTPGATPAEGAMVSFGGPVISRFTWDEDRAGWLREQANVPGDEELTPHMDAADEQLAPTNVVIMEIEYDFSGELGRSIPHGVVSGEGPVTVLTAGHAISGRWVRPSFGEPLQLLTDAGDPILLTPGQTFIELPPPGGMALL